MSDQGYPVTLHVERPERFDRWHVVIRGAVLIAISVLVAFAWVITLIYVAIPIVAAILVSQDKERFRAEGALKLKRWVSTLAALDSYFTLLTDRFSFEKPEDGARLDFEITANPTASSALGRLVTSIPSALALVVLGIAATITGVIAGIIVLFREDYPDTLYRFHHGVVTWTARLLAYHSSLIDDYPPFTLAPPSARSSAATEPA